MNAKPTAGTYRLDGMLQAPLPQDERMIADIRAWVKSAGDAGLLFHLGIEGGSFSLVADPTPRKTSGLKGSELGAALSEGINALLELIPQAAVSAAFSTVRSEEFRAGSAVQSLYAIGMDGRVAVERRTVEAATEDAPPEITPASLRRAFFPAAIGLLLLLFVSTFFIDYRKTFLSARDRLAPLSKEELILQRGFSGDYITFRLVAVDNGKNALVFHLARGSAWEVAMQAKPGDAAQGDWKEFSTLMAIHSGRFRIELYGKEKQLLGSREIDTRELLMEESMEVAVFVKSEQRIASAVLRP
ncbi:hypothetical protein HZ994_06320 [Akkermansiaceae bacterium]|nr:hypothetical protein HZ994_06320 [Akkermansiaceae bacterium]